MSYGQIIHRIFDDSYVITKNGLPYHVYPYAAEFAELWVGSLPTPRRTPNA